jgi:hypothetical protein
MPSLSQLFDRIKQSCLDSEPLFIFDNTDQLRLEETVHVAHPSFVAQLRDSGVPAISVTSVGELAVTIELKVAVDAKLFGTGVAGHAVVKFGRKARPAGG